MTEVFFRGYGCWFVKHKKSGMTFSIERTENNRFFLFPCSADAICKNSYESIGLFSLTKEDAFTYRRTKNKSLIRKMWPSRRYSECEDASFPGMLDSFYEDIFNSTITKITDQVQIGGLRINPRDCYFLIDTEKDFIFHVEEEPENLSQEGVLNKLSITNSEIYKSLTDKTESLSGSITESVFNRSSIRARNPILRKTESLEILHDALDEIENETGKTPCAVDLANYILSPGFKHRNIQESSGREIRLSSGKIVTKKNIEMIYRDTIFKKRQINAE